MEEELISVKGKLVQGVLALTTRTFLLQIISFFATFVLTILLSPSVFGVFFIVSAFISFLSYFSDFGLAAALIQKKEYPTKEELASVFTLQQLLVGSLVIMALIISPYLGSYYKLDPQGIFLLQSLIISFFLSSLKTIPSIILERNLKFELLVIPQILETLVFYLTAIILAVLGKGILSFAWAAILRGIVGSIAIYIISPWQIRLNFRFSTIRHLLSFGIPFQANSLLALVKDDLVTLILGKLLPIAHIGYLGWAKKWAEAPLRLIMDNIIRVTFPVFARLQHDKNILSKALAKSFFFLSFFIFPASLFLMLYIKPMLHFIPKYSKWEPALVPFYLFAFSSILSSFSSPIVNALNAIGKIRTTLKLMLFWTILTWILVPLFTIKFGFVGSSAAYFLISLTAFLPIMIMRKIFYFPILHSIYKPFVTSIITLIITFAFLNMGLNLVWVVTSFLTGISVYILITLIWMKDEIKPYLPKFLKLNP